MIPASLPGRVALFLDVDGTLIDIAPHPDSVIVPESLIEDLSRIERLLGGALALVSGRTIANLDGLFRPLRLRSSGVHGAEYRFDPGQQGVLAGAQALPLDLWSDLEDLIGAFPGTMAENKTYSFAVHYRSAPHVRQPLLAALESFVDHRSEARLKIMPGHFVFEVKRGDFNKGIAVERFLERDEFRSRRPIFIGDDVTDWPGFAAAVARDGFAFSVGTSAPDVTGTFTDPSAVRLWLRQTIHSETVNA